jgi:hypothetical protein
MEHIFRYPVQSNSQFVTTVSQFHPAHFPAYLFQVCFQIICPIYQYFYQVVSFLQLSPPKPCTHLPSLDLITCIKLCEQNKSLLFFLWNYLQSSVAPPSQTETKQHRTAQNKTTHQEHNTLCRIIYSEAESHASRSDRAKLATLPNYYQSLTIYVQFLH